MRALDRFARLDPTDRRLLFEAVWLLGRVRAALVLRPFRRVREDFAPVAAAHLVESAVAPDQIATAVRRASRVIPAATCLPQALAARVMLARRGQASELRIGVARDAQGALQAHAWVEVEGRVIIGALPDLDRYQRMPHLPGDAA